MAKPEKDFNITALVKLVLCVPFHVKFTVNYEVQCLLRAVRLNKVGPIKEEIVELLYIFIFHF